MSEIYSRNSQEILIVIKRRESSTTQCRFFLYESFTDYPQRLCSSFSSIEQLVSHRASRWFNRESDIADNHYISTVFFFFFFVIIGIIWSLRVIWEKNSSWFSADSLSTAVSRGQPPPEAAPPEIAVFPLSNRSRSIAPDSIIGISRWLPSQYPISHWFHDDRIIPGQHIPVYGS